MFKYFDSHSHLHLMRDAVARAGALARLRALGAGTVTVGTYLATSEAAVAFAEQAGAGIFASVGVHPNCVVGEMEAGQRIQETFELEKYRALASHPKVVAIGETGLDYHELPTTAVDDVKVAQRRAFREQIRLADEVGKPVIIHCREANVDVWQTLDAVRAEGGLRAGAVAHCFSGSAADAAEYLKRGCYISFAGTVTFPAKKTQPQQQEDLWAAVRAVPLERLLVETDAPWLAPVPHRGTENEPAHVTFVVAKIAVLRGLDAETVATAVVANARRLFRLSD